MEVNLNNSLDDFDIPTSSRPIKKRKREALIPSLELQDENKKTSSHSSVQAGRTTVDSSVQVSNERAISYRKSEKMMNSTHFTHRKLLQIFFLKESTLDFCFEHGLIPKKRECPTCGAQMRLIHDKVVSDGRRWYCRVKSGSHKHEKRLSLRSGTFFENSNMTLEEILEFVYFWVHGTSLKMIHHEMGLSSNTDVDWASFCREVCEMAMARESVKVGGPGVVVEMDESKFAKRKYNRGHPVKTGWVFGGRERDNKKKVFMVCVPDRSANTLCQLIQQWILPGSIIWSDCWKAYDRIPSLPEGYSHGTVNHSERFVSESGVCTNRIESDWGKAKASLPKFGLKECHLPGYLSTFMWRRFHEGSELFLSMLRDISMSYPGMGMRQKVD